MCKSRTDMPQIDLKDYDHFLQYCHNNGVIVLRHNVHPLSLRSIQCWGAWRHHKVKPATLSKPVLSSGDHILLDGNTRWANAVDLGIERIPNYAMQLDFVASLKFIIGFPLAYILDKDFPNDA